MKSAIFVGEVQIGDKGCVYQEMLAQAMGVERLTTIPKKVDGRHTKLHPHGVA